MRILGIDPGSRVTGFGVLDFDGDKSVYVASGTVSTAEGTFPLAGRRKAIWAPKCGKSFSDGVNAIWSLSGELPVVTV